MWMPLAAAGFFGFILLIILLRAQKSVANVALVATYLEAPGAGTGVSRETIDVYTKTINTGSFVRGGSFLDNGRGRPWTW